MKTIKMLAVLTGALLLVTSCYTQLALVERDVYAKDDYYYPPADTIYSDQGAPLIVQNFYQDPYDFNFGMHFGFYDSWWLWNDWYYPYGPYWGIFYPIRPYNPFLWYPGYYVYDPFYLGYYDYWYWNSAPVYSIPYGPRPFTKGGSLWRGGGSKRVRLSKSSGNDHGNSGAAFLPTRASGGLVSGSETRKSVRKSTGSSIIGNTSKSTIKREGKAVRTVVRKGSVERRTKSKQKVVRRTTKHERKYYPITRVRSIQPKSTVKQPKATPRPYIKTKSRKSVKQSAYPRSTYSTRRSSSGYSPAFSTPSRSSSSRSSGAFRSGSGSSRSTSRSATRSSSGRSGHRRK